MVLLSSGTHFTNVLWAHKCNLARIYLALIWITMALSRHSFAHAFCRGMCDIVNYLNNSFHFYLNLNEQMKVIRRVHWTLHKQHICMWSSRDWDIYQVPHYLSLFLPLSLSTHTHTYIYIYICVCVNENFYSTINFWPRWLTTRCNLFAVFHIYHGYDNTRSWITSIEDHLFNCIPRNFCSVVVWGLWDVII